jgi:hypothetical protein
MPYRVAPCSEFPNDNPSLHEGAIWRCAEIGAGASCEVRLPDGVPSQVIAMAEPMEFGNADVADGAVELEEDVGAVEVVEDFTFEDDLEEQVPTISFEEETREHSTAGESQELTTETTLDVFETFVGVLEEVATASGGDARAVACLHALLGQSRLEGVALDDSVTEALVADALVVRTDRGLVRAPAFTALVLAWRGILRGESEDFAPCGAATLDEWSANLVARVLGLASRAEGIRRELRRRGVAAFGFVAEAA